MAATYSAEHLTARSLRRMLDFDPDSGSAVVVDLDPASSAKTIALTAGYRRFLFGIMRSVGTGQITTARIIACTAADGTGSVTTVVTSSPTTADAVGDTVWLECDVEQVREVLSTAAYVGLEITLQTSTDECVVFVEAAEPTFAVAGLTSNYIS